MGTPAQHREKAEHHRRFLATVSDEFPDWLATVAFYAAVEYIEGLLAARSLHSMSHEDRRIAVQRNYPSIRQAYAVLYNASLKARYEPPDHWLAAGEVRRELIDRRLTHIEKFAASHAAPPPASTA